MQEQVIRFAIGMHEGETSILNHANHGAYHDFSPRIEAASRFPAASASSKLSNMTHPLGGLLASTAMGAPPFQFARHLTG